MIYDTDKIGTNIVNEKIYLDNYKDPYLCSEYGEYYDRKTKGCIKFFDISDATTDIVIKNIDVSYNHNYGIAFWIFLENKSMTESIDFIWKYHMRISLQYVGSSFKAYCFPQNYEPYSKILDDETISLDDRVKEVLNSATNEYTNDLGGEWTWFQCFLSYNNRYFYLNENEQNLITETLYREGNTEFKNDEPLGWFFNGNTGDLSTLTLRLNKNDGKKIYMRSFYLFKDFLPYNYNFRYMDLSKITTGQFPPLTFATNFADYSRNNKKITLNIKKFSSDTNKLNATTQDINVNTDNFELAPNFVFLPLCNPVSKEKFNSETSLCEEITTCDYTELNAEYCMEEATPLICKKNFYINIDSSTGAVDCQNYCRDSKYFRTPGTEHTTGICGTKCLSEQVLKTCPNSASSILTYQNDFECVDKYYRIGYQCIPEPSNNSPNKGALFYSGINYPYNIVHTFSNDVQKEIGNNYVLEFWFMIDNTIYTDFNTADTYHYFYAAPHEIYMKNKEYFYRLKGSSTKQITPGLIHQYEWNKILIFVKGDKNEVDLIINFDKEGTIPIPISGSYVLKNIAFCSQTRNTGGNYPYYIACLSIKNMK